MSARDLSRPARVLGALAALFVGTGLMVTEAAAVLAPPTSSATAIELSDDDSAAALFSVSEMAPGHPSSSCMALAYTADGAASLRLYGTSVGSGLDRALWLVVEEGSGGRFGDCSGFTGSPVYAGTLADFARDHRDFASGLALAATPSDTPAAYRFTVDVLSDDSAQGTDAEATFTWEAQDAPPPPVTPTTAPTTPAPPTTAPPTASPTASPTVPPTAAPVAPAAPASQPTAGQPSLATPPTQAVPTRSAAPNTAAPRSTAEERVDTGRGTGAPAANIERTVPGEAAGAPQGTIGGVPQPAPPGAPADASRSATRLTPVDDRSLTEVLGTVIEAVATAAVAVLEKSAFPGGLLVLAGLFLLVQDSIDRKDPKLALAPVYPDPDLRFDDFERMPVR